MKNNCFIVKDQIEFPNTNQCNCSRRTEINVPIVVETGGMNQKLIDNKNPIG